MQQLLRTAKRAGAFRYSAAIAATAVAAILLLWCFVGLIGYASVHPPGFDGGLNLRVAQSFGEGRGYGFFYDSFFPFPAQTDGPFILPAALALRVGGVTALSTQIVNLLYVAAFAGAFSGLLLRCGAPLWFALVGALLPMQVPGFVVYGMNGFGEVVVLSWFIFGLMVLTPVFDAEEPKSSRFAIGGIAFALAYLTKAVALLCIAPSSLAALVFIGGRPHSFRRATAFALGISVPIVAWECFRLYQVGSINGYIQWWLLQLGQVQAQSGASSLHPTIYGLISNASIHLNILSQTTGVPESLLLSFIIIPPCVAAFLVVAAGIPMPARFPITSIALVVSIYFGWWLLVTPTHMAWPRRIVAGVILGQCLLALVVAALANGWAGAFGFRSRNTSRFVRIALAVGLAPVVVSQGFLLANGELLPYPPGPGAEADMLPVLAEIDKLPPDAKIFGIGWWQSPVLALFSGRDIFNFERWLPAQIDALPRKYLLTDFWSQALARPNIEAVLASTAYRPIIESAAGSLYELQHVGAYGPFGTSDETATDLASNIDFSNGAYRHVRGVYDPGGGWAWSRPDSAVMLKRFDETHLFVGIGSMPGTVASTAKDDSDVLSVRITIDGCADKVFSMTKGTKQDLDVTLDCPAWPAPRPMVIRFAFDGHLVPVQQIDADNRLLGFMLYSVHLAGQR